MRRSILCLVLLVALAGCGGAPEDKPAPASVPAPVAPPPPSPPQEKVEIKVVPPQPPSTTSGIDKVHEYTRQFYAGELAALHARFSPRMKEILPLDKLRAMREGIEQRYGKEVGVLGEDSKIDGEYRGFVRWARFDKHKGVMEVQWLLRPDDTVGGFTIRPARPPQDGASAPAGKRP